MTGTRKTRKELKYEHAAKMEAKRKARGQVVMPVYTTPKRLIPFSAMREALASDPLTSTPKLRGLPVHGAQIDDAPFMPTKFRRTQGNPQDARFAPIAISAGQDIEKAKELAAARKKTLRAELETILAAKPEFKPSYDAIHRLMEMSDGNPTEGAERRVFLTYDAEPLQEAREIGQGLWDRGGINLMHYALLCVDVRDHAELSTSWDKIGDWRA